MTSEPSQEELLAARRSAIDDVLGLLTVHELYRYRPKAFDGFIEYARSELAVAPADFWGAPAHERGRMLDRLAELENALKPFANEAKNFEGCPAWPDDYQPSRTSTLCLGDFRAAVRALGDDGQ